MLVRTAWVDTPLRRLLVAATERGLCFLHMDAQRAEVELERWLPDHVPGARVVPDSAALELVTGQLVDYAGGRRQHFDLELDLRGTPFQLAVWHELQAIPFGATRTYGELARRLGRPAAARAVGAANGANPIPWIVPCHRVVARGGLGGFGGGLELKRRLLELEGALLGLN